MLQTVGSEGAGGKQISFAVATMQFLKLSVHILSFMVGHAARRSSTEGLIFQKTKLLRYL